MADTEPVRAKNDRMRKEEIFPSYASADKQPNQNLSIDRHSIIISLVTIILFLGGVGAQDDDIRLPPYITVNPLGSMVFRANVQKITLNCSAGGQPPPDYQWYKNGHWLLSIPGGQASGDLIFNTTSADTAGTYQCYATNTWGSTLSSSSQLTVASASLYPPNDPIGHYVKAEGQPLSLPCNAPTSVPNPTYSWAIANGIQDSSPRTMTMSDRLQINPENGNLHFSNLQSTDQLPSGQCYKCIVFNSVLDASTGGSYVTIGVNSSGTAASYPPSPSFQSQSPQIGLLGGSISLNCFFNGNPTPAQPTWTKEGGTLPSGRYTLSQWRTTLTLTNLDLSDTGVYKCETTNSAGGPVTPSSVSITLSIQSQPSFISKPVNVNASDGDNVVFNCVTSGDPSPDIIWYKNAIELSINQLPNKYSLSPNHTSLTVRDVCKTCSDGSNDLAVIQCSSSNSHGEALASGYLNVLDRTTISLGPAMVTPPAGSEPFSLPCAATTDPSTPLTITWYVSGNRVYNETDKWYVDEAGTLTVVGSAPQGNYSCVASNGFSSDTSWASIGATIVQAGSTWWIIVVVIVVLLLLLLLIALVIYCMRQNKGDQYMVDEKEQLNGNDPEKELRDTGFKEHQRGDLQPGSVNQMMTGGSMMMTASSSSLTNVKSRRGNEVDEGREATVPSGGSISSSLPPTASVDGDSLNEYLNRDRVGRFDDDGSFLPSHIAPIPEQD